MAALNKNIPTVKKGNYPSDVNILVLHVEVKLL